MDQELIAYFDELRESSRRTERLYEQTTQQIAGLQEQISGLRQETREQIAGLQEQISGLRQETSEQIAGLRQETREQIRHTQILVENLHDQIRILAEGFIGLEERMTASQGEVAKEFRTVGHTIELYYRDLEKRIRVVEERTEREGRDPMDIIRERYGKRKEERDQQGLQDPMDISRERLGKTGNG